MTNEHIKVFDVDEPDKPFAFVVSDEEHERMTAKRLSQIINYHPLLR
jgi:hypothetical protein